MDRVLVCNAKPLTWNPVTTVCVAMSGLDAAAKVLEESGQPMTPREQARVVELLVERVDYDGQNGSVSITFRPTGIKTLGAELDETEEYAA